MADILVPILLENVTQLLKNEAKLLYGVGDQVKSLQLELTTINEFLENSQKKREKVGDLVNLIRDVAHEAEDIIETFVINMAMHKRRNTVDKFLHSIQHTSMLRSVATDIESIKIQIANIYRNKDTYGINDKETGDDSVRRSTLQSRRNRVEENEVVSFVKDAEIVIQLLTDSGSRGKAVSILGMGGLGKTTLAKKVYNNRNFKNRFHCRAWVSVSQEFTRRDLLMNILQSVTEVTAKMYKLGEENLIEELKKCFETKSYLVVLDDVWSTEVWDGIKDAFPNTYNGRVLITTRIKEVALHASPIPPYLLPLLDKENSWKLFSRKAFWGEGCPEELEKDARRIAEKCNGLPLALVVAGGLLAKREKSTHVLSKMADNVSWYLSEDPEKCFDILALSYEELSPKLKPCFLYFGVFPEDFEIPVRQLIRLWVAEGFIKEDKSRKPEDIAEEYLEELIDRSLITVVSKSSDGCIKSCSIHDLLLDLSIIKGLRENFLVVHSGINKSTSLPTCKPRRLSVRCKISRYISTNPYDSSRVRSLHCFGDKDKLNSEYFLSLHKDFRFLRVLDFGATAVPRVLHHAEKLVLLRYLKMNAPHLVEIPSSISGLPNLQTLDLSESKILNFRRNFWDMQQLRHLFLSGECYCLVKEAKPMPNLETFFTANSSIFCAVDFDFHEVFPNLTNLGVICSSSCIDVFDGLQDVTSIKIIKISGELAKPIKANGFSLNLTKITLAGTKSKQSEFAKVAEFPNLQTLKLLRESLVGSHIKCNERGFPQLQVLHMEQLRVHNWSMKSGAMKNLQSLFIRSCYRLHELPEELKQVTTLRHISTYKCSSYLTKNIRQFGKNIVKHNSEDYTDQLDWPF